MEYDLEYFEKMLRLNSKTAEEICRIRWKWIGQVRPKTVLDFGSGVGFFRAFRPPGIEVQSFDIGPFPQTGIKLTLYDVVCFFDVLEHIHDFSTVEPVLALAKHLAITVPVKPANKPFATWKHAKPGEHGEAFTEEGMDDLASYYGFKLIKKGTPECPPREDITSFLYKKIRLYPLGRE